MRPAVKCNNAPVIIKHGVASGVTDLKMNAAERCEGFEAFYEWLVMENTYCLLRSCVKRI